MMCKCLMFKYLCYIAKKELKLKLAEINTNSMCLLNKSAEAEIITKREILLKNFR